MILRTIIPGDSFCIALGPGIVKVWDGMDLADVNLAIEGGEPEAESLLRSMIFHRRKVKALEGKDILDEDLED